MTLINHNHSQYRLYRQLRKMKASGKLDCRSYMRGTTLCFFQVVTVLHWMQGGLVRRKVSVCLPVCLSVCPSVKRVDCDKTEEKSVQIFKYHTKDH